MRVLIAHNRYQFTGGEESVVDDETRLLKQMGHEVELYTRDNRELSEVGPMSAALQALWSNRTIQEVRRLLGSFRPQVLHIHNTFPLISPAILWAGQSQSQPLAIVQTLHNFRLLCIEPSLTREGQVCEACVGRVPWQGVVHRCYRKSLSQSFVAAGTLQLHRWLGSYRSKVHRFIALTEFARQKFVSAGFEPQRVVVKPNFVVPDGSIEYKGRRSGGIFVGRLSREKGLDVLAEAVRAAGIAAIDVVGTGPELNKLQQHSTLRLLGWKSQGVVRDLIRRASYLVLPSICYESFGRAVLEAYSAGVPVIASRLGALPELVEEGETGLLFSPGSATDLASRLAWAEQNPHEMRRMGESARHCYRRLYTPEKNYERLRSIYEEAIRDAQQKGGGSDARASRFC